jgi:hypothetical protein
MKHWYLAESSKTLIYINIVEYIEGLKYLMVINDIKEKFNPYVVPLLKAAMETKFMYNKNYG